MANSADDEVFRMIFETNNLEEVMNQSEVKTDLTIEDIQEGLTDLCNLTYFLSSFMLEFYAAFKKGDLNDAPRLKMDSVVALINIFNTAAEFIDLIDVESEDEE